MSRTTTCLIVSFVPRSNIHNSRFSESLCICNIANVIIYAFQATPRQIEQLKKEICAEFSKIGLKIIVEVNKKIVNFLHVTLDLSKGTHNPYAKPNNIPLYVHQVSNHPRVFQRASRLE